MGLDVARGLAIIGMIIVHMASLLWSTKVVINGVPSALFAVIAGTTLMVIGRNYTFDTLRRLIVRGSVVMLLYDVYLKSFVTGSKQRASPA